MPFLPMVLLERLAAMETTPLTFSNPSISLTLKVASLGIWSITVPCSIAEIFTCFFILFFPILKPTMPSLPEFRWLPARSRQHGLSHQARGQAHPPLGGGAWF